MRSQSAKADKQRSVRDLQLIVFLLFFFSCYVNQTLAQAPDSISKLSAISPEELGTLPSLQNYYNNLRNEGSKLSSEELESLNRTGLVAAQKLGANELILNFAIDLEFLSIGLSKYEEAEAYNRIRLEVAELMPSEEEVLESHISLATNFIYQGRFLEAIDQYLLALAYKEKYLPAYTRLIEEVYNNMSLCYLFLGEAKEALTYLYLSKPFIQELEGTQRYLSLAGLYNTTLYCFIELEEKDSIHLYSQQLIENLTLAEEDTADPSFEVVSIRSDLYFALTQYFLLEEKLDSAKIYYQKLDASNIYSADSKYLMDILYAIKTEDFQTAKSLLDTPLDVIDTVNNLEYAELLSSYYEAIGDLKNGLFYTKKYKELQIEELKTQRVKLSAYSKERLDAIEKENRIDRLEKEQTNQARLTLIFLVLFILLFLLALLLVFLYRQINAKNRLLKLNIEDQQVIAEQAKRLHQVDEEKSRLFTNIAHEFQTPLNVIQGLGKHLQANTGLPDFAEEPLEIIIRNSIHLSESTSQILEISSSATLKPSSNPVWFSLLELVRFVLREHEFLTLQKTVNVQTPDWPETVNPIFSDVEKVETIVKNLFTNAIKFTPSNGSISITFAEDPQGFYELSFEDTGRGIPEEELPRIFDRYYQSSLVEDEGGFGLGLAICKEYSELLGGEIRVRSSLGKGSMFSLYLPQPSPVQLEENIQLYQFPQSKPDLPLHPKIRDERIPEKALHLLVVEDNRDFCNYLNTILSNEYYLKFVHNGYEAIEHLKKYRPALILTDWMMPDMNGLKLAYFLRASEEYSKIPLLMLTARNLMSDQIKALRVGLDDYLTKPIDSEVLKTRIRELLQRQEEKEDFTSLFPSPKSDIPLSTNDQNWLVEIEKIIFPLISNFDLTVEQIAQLSDMSAKNLNRKIKATTGLTAKKFIQEIRYWEARRMLETGEYQSVKAVCLSVGLKDIRNFSRKFKERFGLYPSECIKQPN